MVGKNSNKSLLERTACTAVLVLVFGAACLVFPDGPFYCEADDECDPAANETCDLVHNRCLAGSSNDDFCNADGQCDAEAGELCDLRTNRCVLEEGFCNADGQCDAAAGELCDVAQNRCVSGVDCVHDLHCDAPTPLCSAEGECVQCAQDSHCGSHQVCLAGSCVGASRTHVCSPKPAVGTEWNLVSEYQQEWSSASQRWEPPDSVTVFDETPSENSCRYRCDSGHRWDGSGCAVRPTCSAGTHLGPSLAAADLLSAMGMCDEYDENVEGSFGIVPGSARIGRANWPTDIGVVDPLQYAVKEQFGSDSSNLPRFGGNMAILSTGRARDATDEDPTDGASYPYDLGVPPSDFVSAHGGSLPRTRTDCPAGTGANDSVNLMVQLRVPDFANGFSFDFRFFSQEYQNFTCQYFNDFFITMLDSTWTPPEEGDPPIPADKNISFDTNGSYISVNSDQFFTVCRPKTCETSGVQYECLDGTSALNETGYIASRAGATSWLTTSAPAVPGEIITLRFIIWDSSDTDHDSLVLLDNFRWRAAPGRSPQTEHVIIRQ